MFVGNSCDASVHNKSSELDWKYYGNGKQSCDPKIPGSCFQSVCGRMAYRTNLIVMDFAREKRIGIGLRIFFSIHLLLLYFGINLLNSKNFRERMDIRFTRNGLHLSTFVTSRRNER